ncbi:MULTISPECIES: hypothetical protein [Streptomyces]|uniref:Uncharacterized protein n=1 Tax=Streptomyces sp. 900129855 TaxID=3155129 RepID=A0ABV2ZNQ5_9ACTN
MWWWAVVRLAVTSDAGVLEGAVAAGGWGLSLLPVHCVTKARAAGALVEGRWRSAWRAVRQEGMRKPGGGGEAAGGGAPGPERGRGRQGR